MRFLSTFYISAIAGQLGMTTFCGCGHGGSGRTTNSQEHDETVAVQLGKESPMETQARIFLAFGQCARGR
jgi:hypothetical protein